MKLFYRGHSYNAHNTNVPAQDVPTEGTYRGVKVTLHQKHARVNHPQNRVYRGVHID